MCLSRAGTGDEVSPSDWRLTSTLSEKCTKSIFRNPTVKILMIVSTFALFGLLAFVWFMTTGEYELHRASEKKFDKLHFKMQCSPNMELSAIDASSCVAVGGLYDLPGKHENGRTTRASNVLQNLLRPDTMTDGISDVDNDFKETADFAEAVGSSLLNGLPVLGLDDWFMLSDLMNKHINAGMLQSLMQYSSIKGRFINLLGVRDLRLAFTPDNCWTRSLIDYLNKTTENFKNMEVSLYDSMYRAMIHKTDSTWAVIEINYSNPSTSAEMENQCSHALHKKKAKSTHKIDEKHPKPMWNYERPQLTIRMHPIAVPDTRSYRWDPVIDNAFDSLETGQLLYYMSGFLTLQLEIQKFFSGTAVGGASIDLSVLKQAKEKLVSQVDLMNGLLNVTKKTSTSPLGDLLQSVLDSHPQSSGRNRPVIDAPIFLRALSQPSYLESKFWQQFGEIITTALIVYFSIPAALAGGKFSNELKLGHIEMLSTIPGVRLMHSALAWCICVAAMLGIWGLAVFLFFSVTLNFCTVFIPVINLFLLGVALAPISMSISMILQRSDAVVVVVPTVVFVLMLPGLLYFDMAFDSQRTIATELILCLSPPSAAALVLRQMCSLEALGYTMTWCTVSPGAKTPLYCYTMMLVVDAVLYTIIVIGASEFSSNIYVSNIGDDTDGVLSPDDLYFSKICKSYSGLQGSVSVLTDISGAARIGTVTTILGSNGAGKSTLMRIIAGLDPEYDGCIHYPTVVDSSSFDRRPDIDRLFRLIGWCPQQDALFEHLTVIEHFSLYADLLGCALGSEYFDASSRTTRGWRYSASKREKEFNRIFNSLGLVNERGKPAAALSGGMKRRLTLALASLGNPTLLILDEPTSGCDSQTREKLRQWILASRQKSAVLMSTHHVDDIAIVSDRVWYLNDTYLRYDGTLRALQDCQYDGALPSSNSTAASSPAMIRPVSQLKHSGVHNKKTVRFLDFDISWGQKALNFKIGSPDILKRFKEAVKEDSTASLFWGPDGGGLSFFGSYDSARNNNFMCISIPGRLNTFMYTFVKSLEKTKLSNWSLSSPNVFKAVTAAAAEPAVTPAVASRADSNFRGLVAEEQTSLNGASPSQSNQRRCRVLSVINADLRHIWSILKLRWAEMRCNITLFSFFYVFIPFVVVLLVALSCGGNIYPKLQLVSGAPVLPSLGEIPVSSGILKYAKDGRLADRGTNAARRTLQSILERLEQTAAHPDVSRKDDDLHHLLVHEKNSLLDTFGDHVDWQGSMDSSDIEKRMENEIFDHEYDRWGAFTINDKIGKFYAGSVYMPEESLQLTPDAIFQEAEIAHQSLCETTEDKDVFDRDDTTRRVGERWVIEKSLFFCGHDASTRIGVARRVNTTTNVNNSALVITSYSSLESNVSLICNTTAHHAAPIFLKEVVTAAYDTVQRLEREYDTYTSDRRMMAGLKPDHNFHEDSAEDSGDHLNFKGSPQYDLFSFPFPEINLFNEGSMWHGYLGASFVLLLMLISTMVNVRFITQFRSSGVKHLMHLAGVSIPSFWIGNYIFDTVVMIIILLAVYAAIFFGGAPVNSFYFDLPPYFGGLFLALIFSFSCAIVAANYAFNALSADELTSQLSCVLSSIMLGVCLKLYIQLHKADGLNSLSTAIKFISPSFAFTSALFDMFSQYATNIGKSSGVLNDENCPGLSNAVYFDIKVMLGQAVGYLTIVILIDMYWVRIKSFMRHALPSIYLDILNIRSWLGNTWTGIRAASVASLSALENEFSIRFLWNGLTRSQRMEQEDLEAYDPESSVGLDSELRPLLPGDRLPRQFSDPELVDEESGYGSVWDISKSEMLLSPTARAAASIEVVEMEPPTINPKPSKPIIVISDLCMEYAHQSAPAIHSLSMSVHEAERVALVGVNGGGKSTLFRTLSSASSKLPKSGTAAIMGENVVTDTTSIFDQRLAGYVPQEGGLLGFMTVAELLSTFKSFCSDSTHDNDLDLNVMEEKYLHYPIRSLSGGNKKKLSLMVANMHHPKALLLDECTTGIDPDAAEKVLECLRDHLTDEQSMLFSSHRVEECVDVCDKIIVLCDGNIVLDGPIKRFYDMASEFYMVDIGIYNDSQSIPVANGFIDLLRGSLSSRLSSDLAAADLKASILTSTVIYSPTLVRLMCRKNSVPLSIMWQLLEEFTVAKHICYYYFRDVGMEEVLSVLISETTIALDR